MKYSTGNKIGSITKTMLLVIITSITFSYCKQESILDDKKETTSTEKMHNISRSIADDTDSLNAEDSNATTRE